MGNENVYDKAYDNNENAYDENTNNRVNPILLKFLDENTAKGKLQIIERYGDELDDRTLTNIEASLDIVAASNDHDDRIGYIRANLRTRAQYETTRLR